jgi:hypothetical protein
MRKFTDKLDEMFGWGYPEDPKIPTAVEFLHSFREGEDPDDDTVFEAMVEFAKLHVEKALEQAYERGEIKEVKKVDPYDYADKSNYGIDKDSIIRAYPLSNIK